MSPSPVLHPWVARLAGRLRRLGPALALALVALLPTATHAQVTFDDCTEPICVKFIDAYPTVVEPGVEFQGRVAYGMLLPGEYTNLSVTVTFGDWVQGSSVVQDNPGWTSSCALLPQPVPPDYQIECTFTNPGPLVVTQAGIGGSVFTVNLRPPAGRVPDGVSVTALATFTGTFDPDGADGPAPPDSSLASHDERDLTIDGQARIRVPNLAYSGGAIRLIELPPGSGTFVRARVYSASFRVRNARASDDKLGSNGLYDVLAAIDLPPWQWLLDVRESAPRRWAETSVPRMTAGADIRLDYATNLPLRVDGDPVTWDWRANLAGLSAETSTVAIDTFILCDDLADPGFANLTGLPTLTASGYEQTTGDPTRLDFSPTSTRTLFIGTTETGPCVIGGGPGNVKQDSLSQGSGSGISPLSAGYTGLRNTFNITYNPPANVFAITGDIRVIDTIPPYMRLHTSNITFFDPARGAYYAFADVENVTESGTHQHPDFDEVYICVLPELREAGDVVPPPASPKYFNGAAQAYHVLPPDPFAIGHAADPSGIPAWNGTRGCVHPSQVDNPDPGTNTRYSALDKSFRAMDATHVLVRAPSGWRNADPTRTPEPLRLAMVLMTDDLVPAPVVSQDGSTRQIAVTQNIARLKGGSFDNDGAPTSLEAFWGESYTTTTVETGATQSAIVSHGYYIDNRRRIFPTLNSYQPGFTPGAPVDRNFPIDEVGTVTVELRTAGTPVPGASVTLTLPPGFEFAEGAFDTEGATRKIIENGAGQGFVYLDANAAFTDPDSASATGDRTYDNVFGAGWDGAVEVTGPTSIFDATLGYDRWQIRVKLPDTFRLRTLLAATGGVWGLEFGVVARANIYPFTTAPNVVDVLAEGAELTPGDVTAPGTAKWDLFVPAAETIAVDYGPACDLGNPHPSFDVTLSVLGGADSIGLTAITAIPRATVDGSLGLFLDYLVEPTTLPGQPSQPTIHLSDAAGATPPATADASWYPYTASAAGHPNARWLRVRFPDPAGMAARTEATLRFVLRPERALTLADLAREVVVIGRFGSTLVPYAWTTPSEPSILGTCPAKLVVSKYWDADRSGDNDDEDPLAGFLMTVDVADDWAPAGPIDPALRAADTKAGTTGADGRTSVIYVWPGQALTISETPRAVATVPNGIDRAEYQGSPWDLDTSALTWTQTDPAGGAAISHTVTFAELQTAEFGNSCACDDQNLCTTDACLPCTQAEVDAGLCADGFKCRSTYALTDACALDDACYAASLCDPATGACGDVGPPECGETFIQFAVTVGSETIWLECQATVDARGVVTAIDCDRDDDGAFDLAQEATFCGSAE
ncbi:MAG: hypothetical protein IT385_18455 [Deltaproteobacteria bacterium]|nr:hypothetical protein [Deltaproteobacteria bacterium]